MQDKLLLFAAGVASAIVYSVAHDPVNLALNKTATASSVHTSPQLAFDGNMSPMFQDGSCFNTPFEFTLQWLSVDLDGAYVITSVNVTNRADCCSDRMHDVYVEVFSDNNDTPGFCSSHDGAVGAGETIRLTCNPPQFGRHVRLSRPTTSNERLAVCEMQVFGYRPSQQCKCSWSGSTVEGSRYERKVGARLDPTNFTNFQGETTLPACGKACHGSVGCIGFNYKKGVPCMLVRRHVGFTEDSEWSVFLLEQC